MKKKRITLKDRINTLEARVEEVFDFANNQTKYLMNAMTEKNRYFEEDYRAMKKAFATSMSLFGHPSPIMTVGGETRVVYTDDVRPTTRPLDEKEKGKIKATLQLMAEMVKAQDRMSSADVKVNPFIKIAKKKRPVSKKKNSRRIR